MFFPKTSVVMILASMCTHSCLGKPASMPSLRGGQCGKSDLPCLPGMDVIGAGFDIISGTSVGKQQIISFAYTSQQLYVNVSRQRLRDAY